MDLSNKRPRRELQETSSQQNLPSVSTSTAPSKDSRTNTLPLRGIKICLSGFFPEEKLKIHRQIEALGGSYTRDLAESNTHLIAAQPTGDKYEAAVTWEHIYVVKVSWIDACTKARARIPEREHLFAVTSSNALGQNESLEKVIQSLLGDTSNKPWLLFRHFCFYLVGFDIESEEYRALGRLLRAATGTIFWEYHADVTHVIVQDGTKEPTRYDMVFVRRQRVTIWTCITNTVFPRCTGSAELS